MGQQIHAGRAEIELIEQVIEVFLGERRLTEIGMRDRDGNGVGNHGHTNFARWLRRGHEWWKRSGRGEWFSDPSDIPCRRGHVYLRPTKAVVDGR